MTDNTRRTVDYLVALYELEPSIKDVFVEGQVDRTIIEWYLGEVGRDQVSVYEIDVIHVEVKRGGNRGRVIELSRILDERLWSAVDGKLCIVDRDCDDFLGGIVVNRFLAYTDPTCIEGYLAKEDLLGKFSLLYFRDRNVLSKDIVFQVIETLKKVYLVRLIKRVLCPSIRWISFTRCCEKQGNKIVYDLKDHIERILTSGGRSETIVEFLSQVDQYRERVREFEPICLNGHDFFELVIWYCRITVGNGRILERRVFERSITTCLELRFIERDSLFRRLASL